MTELEQTKTHPVVAGFKWRRLAHMPEMRMSKANDFMVRTLRRLKEWGVVVPDNSRLPRAERCLRAWIETERPPMEPRDRDLIAEGFRSAVEFYFATHGPAGEPTEEMLAKCRTAIGGADLPTDEEQHSARDMQFELTVHGILAAAGMRPWFDERPDIRFRYGDQTIGVAVKRLWSRERAHAQLSIAAGQIAESGVRGIVATNVQEYLDDVPPDENIAARGESFNAQVTRVHGQFGYLATKPHVMGLMLAGTVAKWLDPEPDHRPQLAVANYHQVLNIANDDQEHARLEAFFAPTEEALRDWMALNM